MYAYRPVRRNNFEIRMIGPPIILPAPQEGPPVAPPLAGPGAQPGVDPIPPRPRPIRHERPAADPAAPPAEPIHRGLINIGERERFVIRHALTQEQLMYFERVYPNLNIEIQPDAMPHTHPRLAFDRRYSERVVYNSISRPDSVIVDIGGNPIRHAGNHRQNVHSCCPILDPVDSVRHHNYNNPTFPLPMVPRFCAHRAEECDCVIPTTYLSVHSLYYLTPVTVLALLNRATSHSLHAIVHEFPDIYGSFAAAEAQYRVNPDQMVHMHVTGNSQPYVHSVMPWLKRGYFSDGVTAMSWTAQRDFASCRYYKFVLSPLNLSNSFSSFTPFETAVASPDSYGSIVFAGRVFGSNSDAHHTILTELHVNFDSFISWGNWILGTGTTATRHFMVPKTLVLELAARVAGLVRNPIEFGRLLGYARIHIRQYDLPPAVISDSLVLSTCLAFTLNLYTETILFQQMNNRASPQQRLAHEQALQFQYQPLVDVRPFMLLFLLFLCSTPLYFFFPPAETLCCCMFVFAFVFYRYTQRRLCFPSEFYSWFQRSSLFQSLHSGPYKAIRYGFARYNLDYTSFPFPYTGAYPLSSFPRFQSLEVARPILPLNGVATRGLTYAPVEPNYFVGVGLINPTAIPVVHRRCPENDFLAITNRFVVRRPEPNPEIMEEFLGFVDHNFDVLFPGIADYRDYLTLNTFSDEWFTAYAEWNYRFPGPMRQLHNDSLIRHLQGITDPVIYMRLESFMKTEKLLHGSLHTVKHGDPRSIQARNQDLNVVTGPWVFRASTVLRRSWSINHFICYASGLNNLELGSWLPEHNPPDLEFHERDAERFDASIHPLHILVGLLIYARLFADQIVLQHKKRDIKKRGATKYGAHFATEGRVGSGTDDTNLFDSLINALMDLFLCWRRSGLTLLHYLAQSRYRTIVCGDDGITSTKPGRYLFTADYLLLGFVIELCSILDTRDMTFCSGRFWPTSHGMVFCVNLGRVFTKNAYYVDVPERDLYATHRAVLIALLHDFSFIPPIVAFAECQLRALPPKITGRPRYVPGSFFSRFNIRNVQPLAIPATHEMLSHVYGWTSSDQVALVSACKTVYHLPSVFVPPAVDKFISTDSCTYDPKWYALSTFHQFDSYLGFIMYQIMFYLYSRFGLWNFLCFRFLSAFHPILYLTRHLTFLDLLPAYYLSLVWSCYFAYVFLICSHDFAFVHFYHLRHTAAEFVTFMAFAFLFLRLLDDIASYLLAIRYYVQDLTFEGTFNQWIRFHNFRSFGAISDTNPLWQFMVQLHYAIPSYGLLSLFPLPKSFLNLIPIFLFVLMEELLKRHLFPYLMLSFILTEGTLKHCNGAPLIAIVLCSTMHVALSFTPLHFAVFMHFVWNLTC